MIKTIVWKLFHIETPSILIIAEEYKDGVRTKFACPSLADKLDIFEEADDKTKKSMQAVIDEIFESAVTTKQDYYDFINGKYQPESDIFKIVGPGIVEENMEYITEHGLNITTQTVDGMAIRMTAELYLSKHPGAIMYDLNVVRKDYGLPEAEFN